MTEGGSGAPAQGAPAQGAPAQGPAPAASVERDRLLGLIADHLLAHGISDLTLRALARGIGSNNRMLLYYFGSKERIIADGIAAAVDRFPILARAIAGLDAGRPPGLARWLDAVWTDIADEANLPYLRLFFELFGLAAHRPERYGPFLAAVGSEWVELVARSLRADGVPASDAHDLATEVVALWRGLQFALLSGAARASLDRSHTAAAVSIERRALAAGARNPATATSR